MDDVTDRQGGECPALSTQHVPPMPALVSKRIPLAPPYQGLEPAAEEGQDMDATDAPRSPLNYQIYEVPEHITVTSHSEAGSSPFRLDPSSDGTNSPRGAATALPSRVLPLVDPHDPHVTLCPHLQQSAAERPSTPLDADALPVEIGMEVDLISLPWVPGISFPLAASHAKPVVDSSPMEESGVELRPRGAASTGGTSGASRRAGKSVSTAGSGRGSGNFSSAAAASSSDAAVKPFACTWEGCSVRFSHSSYRSVHMRTHTGEKPYACEVPGCNKRFTQSCSLTVHMRLHTKDKPLHCTICRKNYFDATSFAEHQSLHAVEKPFQCPFCDKKYSQSTALSRHARECPPR